MTDSRTCPDCSAVLDTFPHEGVELDRCPAGHGVWLDRGELRAVVASEAQARPQGEQEAAHVAAVKDGGHALVAESGRATRPCPVCSAAMRLVEYAVSGIPIDECSQHGIWLDAGELERIEAYAEGIRRQARTGVATVASIPVAGIDIPADLLASLRGAGAPPA